MRYLPLLVINHSDFIRQQIVLRLNLKPLPLTAGSNATDKWAEILICDQ